MAELARDWRDLVPMWVSELAMTVAAVHVGMDALLAQGDGGGFFAFGVAIAALLFLGSGCRQANAQHEERERSEKSSRTALTRPTRFLAANNIAMRVLHLTLALFTSWPWELSPEHWQ